MQYRELQAALKNLRHAGYDIQVKLTSSYEILQVEYDRLTSQPVVEPMVEMTAEQFNGWMGLPTDNLAIATQDNPEQPTLALNHEPKPRGNATNLRQNEGSTERQDSKSLVQQEFESMPPNSCCISKSQQPNLVFAKRSYERLEASQDKDFCIRLEPREYLHKQPQHNPEVLSHKEISIPPITSYWIDGSELSQHLESTQVQALRNAQDGVRWLKKWARNIQAFAEGFIEGGQVKQPQRSPQDIALDRYRYPQVA